MKNYCNSIIFIFFSIIALSAAPLSQPLESYYTIKAYDSPNFHPEALSLDQCAFLHLINKVHQKTHDRAFLIEVPNQLYSENVGKLRSAGFFHYHDYPENNSSFWCRTNGSGIPLAASHTLGIKSIVYYKQDNEYYFLLIKDRYGNKSYEFPGGYVQPEDSEIAQAFEQGIYISTNLDYRSPQEAGISEVFEETGFNLQKYGYGQNSIKIPLTIGQVYTKNTRPLRGIHSVNDCCQYLLFEVMPNNDPLQKQAHEILDVCWAKYTDIINNNIPSSLGITFVTDTAKALIQRVVLMSKYKEIRKQLSMINQKIKTLLSSTNFEKTQLIELVQEQLNLYKQSREFERKLIQSNNYANNVYTTYFVPL